MRCRNRTLKPRRPRAAAESFVTPGDPATRYFDGDFHRTLPFWHSCDVDQETGSLHGKLDTSREPACGKRAVVQAERVEA